MDLGFAVMDKAGTDPKDTAGQDGWTTINCASKCAYGCGKGANSVVQDLDLLLYHGDLEKNMSAALSVRVGDKAFRWVDRAIAKRFEGRFKVKIENDKDHSFRSKVEIVDKGLIIVTVSICEYSGFDYYLVFDSVDRSLSMIPWIPEWASCYTNCPLPLRHEEGGYSVVLFGDRFGFNREGLDKYLWQWSPQAKQRGNMCGPWQTKMLRLPAEMQGHLFSPDVLFSSKHTAFWTDLALGTLSCDCSALFSGSRHLEFNFIHLPPGYLLDRDDDDNDDVEMYRTMGYVGGSIKFVSVDTPDDRGARFKVWTLAPSYDWELNSDIPLKKLWKDFKGAGLPKNLPMWPLLREQEGDSFYFILVEEAKTRGRGQKHHICRLDTNAKSLMQSKLLAHRWLINEPLILPSGFFQHLDPSPSSPGPDLSFGSMSPEARSMPACFDENSEKT